MKFKFVSDEKLHWFLVKRSISYIAGSRWSLINTNTCPDVLSRKPQQLWTDEVCDFLWLIQSTYITYFLGIRFTARILLRPTKPDRVKSKFNIIWRTIIYIHKHCGTILVIIPEERLKITCYEHQGCKLLLAVSGSSRNQSKSQSTDARVLIIL